MSSSIRLLYVEDSEDDQILTLRKLKKEGLEVICKRVDTLPDFESALDQETWDVVLSDYNVPGMNVLETLKTLKNKGFDLPFILVSGTIGEETAVEVMRAGAHDYVMKGTLARLPSAIKRELADAKSRAEKRKNAAALLESEKQLRKRVGQQNAMLAIDRAIQEMTTPQDLENVVRVCFDQFKKVELAFSAVAIKRIIDPNEGVFAFYEVQPDGCFNQFTTQSPNLFRKWRLGKTVYRPNLDEDMGGLVPEDRQHMSNRYKRPMHSILNVCFDLGVLSLLCDQVDPFGPDEITFLEQVVVPISIGMHRLQDMEQLEAVVRHLPEGICMFDSFNGLVFANALGKGFLKSLGIDEQSQSGIEIDGLSMERLYGLTKELPHQILMAGEKELVLEVIVRPIREEGLAGNGWVAVLRDVTQEQEVATMLQRQDRLASIGQLAAGIAHDFNNMLTVMSGFAQILEMNPDLDQQTKDDLAQISEQGQRGAHLVRQILDFSRDSDVERQPIDILSFLKESVKLFQRTLPETISVTDTFPEGAYTILANITQLQQVLHNLAVNARDAMPQGGTIAFGAQHIETDEQMISPIVGMPAGRWLHLTVTDTGSGMTSETLNHIFEPFFSTKEVGKGTGLGLAQVYGIVTKHDGFIDVDSQVGTGTTISMYFPLVEQGEAAAEENVVMPLGDGQCVLVVEDNDQVLHSLEKMLEHLNYRVKVARSVSDAQQIIFESGLGIDAILTDLIMPEESGLDLFENLLAQNLSIPLTIMTGYPSEAKRFESQIGKTSGLILKPLDIQSVAIQIQKMCQ